MLKKTEFRVRNMTDMENKYIIASDYMVIDGSEDVSGKIQDLIDAKANRTIFFPDGVYLLKKPVLTSSDNKKSVDLVLSNFARFLASPDWDSQEAMVRLGAKDHVNTLDPGANYTLTGGIIDGAGIAAGVSIDGGRETRVQKPKSVFRKHRHVCAGRKAQGGFNKRLCAGRNRIFGRRKGSSERSERRKNRKSHVRA